MVPPRVPIHCKVQWAVRWSRASKGAEEVPSSVCRASSPPADQGKEHDGFQTQRKGMDSWARRPSHLAAASKACCRLPSTKGRPSGGPLKALPLCAFPAHGSRSGTQRTSRAGYAASNPDAVNRKNMRSQSQPKRGFPGSVYCQFPGHIVASTGPPQEGRCARNPARNWSLPVGERLLIELSMMHAPLVVFFCMLICVLLFGSAVFAYVREDTDRASRWAAATFGCSCLEEATGILDAPLTKDPYSITCGMQRALCELLCGGRIEGNSRDAMSVAGAQKATGLVDRGADSPHEGGLPETLSPRRYWEVTPANEEELGSPSSSLSGAGIRPDGLWDRLPAPGAPPRRLSEPQLGSLGEPWSIVSLCLVFIASFVAVATGTGGGVFYVPILTLVMGYPVHRAAAISMACICGNTSAITFLNLQKRHPFADRPLIDLNLVVFISPAQIAGVGFGTVIGFCLPAWMVAMMLSGVLVAMTLQAKKHHEFLRFSKERCCCCFRRCCPVSSKPPRVEAQQQPYDQWSWNGASAAVPSSFTGSDASVWGSNISIRVETPPSDGSSYRRSHRDRISSIAPSPPSAASSVPRHVRQQQTAGGHRAAHPTRMQTIATMLNMRFDSGVWMLHAGDEISETAADNPGASSRPMMFASSRGATHSFTIGLTGEHRSTRQGGSGGLLPWPNSEGERLVSTRQGVGSRDPCSTRSRFPGRQRLREAARKGAAPRTSSHPGPQDVLRDSLHTDTRGRRGSGGYRARRTRQAPWISRGTKRYRGIVRTPVKTSWSAEALQGQPERERQPGPGWWGTGQYSRQNGSVSRTGGAPIEGMPHRSLEGMGSAPQRTASFRGGSSQLEALSSCYSPLVVARRCSSAAARSPSAKEGSLVSLPLGNGEKSGANAWKEAYPSPLCLTERSDGGGNDSSRKDSAVHSTLPRAFSAAELGEPKPALPAAAPDPDEALALPYSGSSPRGVYRPLTDADHPSAGVGMHAALASSIDLSGESREGSHESISQSPGKADTSRLPSDSTGPTVEPLAQRGLLQGDNLLVQSQRLPQQQQMETGISGMHEPLRENVRGDDSTREVSMSLTEDKGKDDPPVCFELPGGLCGIWRAPFGGICGEGGVGTPSERSEESPLAFPAPFDEAKQDPEALNEALTEAALRVAHMPSLERKNSPTGLKVEILAPSRMASSGAPTDKGEETPLEENPEETKPLKLQDEQAETIRDSEERLVPASPKTLRLLDFAQRVDDPLAISAVVKKPPLLRTKTAIKNMERGHSLGKWLLVTAVWAIYVILGFIRGNRNSPTHIVPFCGVWYWLLFVLANAFALLFSYGRGLVMWVLQKEKDAAGVEPVRGDMHYDIPTINTFLLQTVASGTLGCTIGVGGGMFLGPLMLINGMLPPVAQATNSAAIVFSSSSGVLYSLYSRNIPWDIVAVLYGLSCFSALAGKIVVNCVIRSPEWSNRLSLLLVFNMCTAAVAMAVKAILVWVKNNDIERFRSPCG